MDRLTAVSVSMLPVSRARAAGAFREIRYQSGIDPLEGVLDACGVPAGEWPAAVAIGPDAPMLAYQVFECSRATADRQIHGPTASTTNRIANSAGTEFLNRTAEASTAANWGRSLSVMMCRSMSTPGMARIRR